MYACMYVGAYVCRCSIPPRCLFVVVRIDDDSVDDAGFHEDSDGS